jgi:WD40 repeat protein
MVGHLSWVLCLAEINEYCLASGSADNLIKIWNVSNSELIRTITGHSDWITCLVWIRKKETILASGSKDNTIKLWNTQTGDLIRTLVGHFNTVLSLLILNNGLLASSSADSSIKLWNYTDNGKDLKTLQSQSKVNRIEILNNGYLASGHQDGSIIIWDTNNGSLCRKIEGSAGLCDLLCYLIRPSSVLNLVVLENGFLVSGHSNGCIRIRDACYEI